MEDLVARSSIEDFGDISFVTIPGVSTLSESERAAVYSRLRQQQTVHDIEARLLLLTPPPADQEEEDEDTRHHEVEARKKLEGYGCPACYPPYLDVPLRDPPTEYASIIGYWQSLSTTGDVVLCAQLGDWEKFRTFQQRVRSRYLNLNDYVDRVRERRRNRDLGGDVCLKLNTEQQSRLENWTEYQAYHLQGLATLEQKLEKFKQELEETREKAQHPDPTVSERATNDVDAVQQDIDYFERKLKYHNVLLEWIEQQRRTMSAGKPITFPEANEQRHAEAIQDVTSTRRRPKSMRSDPPVVLGNVRVTKGRPKKENSKIHNPNRKSTPKPAIQVAKAVPQGNTPQATKYRLTRSQGTNEGTTLEQRWPQKVSKAQRFVGANVRSGISQAQSRASQQQRQPAPRIFKTQSGRISRPPAKWSPG